MTANRMTRAIDTSLVAAAAGAFSVLCAATAFSGVLADSRWLFPAVFTVLAVVAVGAVARRVRWPLALTVFAELMGLLVVLTALFADRAVLGVLPGPAAIGELGDLLSRAGELVRTGVPPVPAEPALQTLVCLGLGVVAVVVDVIVVTFRSPAVTGLVLLCVFAIPASLADDMLPWWTFVAGALGYALLLASGGQHRKWRRHEDRSQVAHTLFGRTTAAVAGTAGVIALLTGAAFTGVGTEGRLPGAVPEQFGGTDGIGLQPFTSLRGQLNRDRVVELFRIRGMRQDSYLRAMTLRKFDPQRGWELEGLTQGVDAGVNLPLPEGTTINRGTPERVEIQPIGYRDPWLPVFGMPVAVSGMGPNWRYDPAAGIVFTQTNQESRPYVQRAILSDPTPDELRNASGPMAVAPAYLNTAGIPPQVADLARQLTANSPTEFDKAVALNRYFTDPANGFRYDLRTAPSTGGDALSDFLFRGKRGFCEQYASSMAVLLRAVGIPSRVAIGFTSGYRDGDERVITTEDAHAWVEAYFPGWGWQTFDPTPLDDGRTSLPQFLNSELHPVQPQAPLPGQALPSTPPTASSVPGAERPDGADIGGTARTPREAEAGSPWQITISVLVLAFALLATPAVVREVRRRRRLHAIAEGTEGAAGLAWQEVLDEFRDRGTRPAAADTARRVATGLIDQHGLDESGAIAMRALVVAVEREWYAPPGQKPDATLPESLRSVLDSLRRAAPLDWRSRLFPRSVLQLRQANL
ncbi:transglutaminaseTgpA domain-containing protein [Saccharopolyspora sp. K220]|uniref:transglutaminase family protein n=1 Tax=Saccharopolyspora soli TaxID=2926618 RepID=UPI001F585296|nr:transglutaminaseTgpA domain-containing protein [Saccharopolyspora soli]MCI2420560.1 transglutaminaseTgpA domain-containing protein [Saccharopolyspora soli]